MPGIFRKAWFPRLKRPGGAIALNSTTGIVGMGVSAVAGNITDTTISGITGVEATTALKLVIQAGPSSLGVEADVATGTFGLTSTSQLIVGQYATAQFTPPLMQATTSNINLTGNFVTAITGQVVGSRPIVPLTGQQVTAIATILFESGTQQLHGLNVTAQVPPHPFFYSPDVYLNGVSVTAVAYNTGGAGGGGGGAAGIYGPGEAGVNGSANGTGGRGGDADGGGRALGAIIPGGAGNPGNELAPGYGSGSGGAGASFGFGAGLVVYNYNGTIYITYISSVTADVKSVTFSTVDNANSPFQIPGDWTNQNSISLVGSGCSDHGATNIVNNVTNFKPGDLVNYFASPFCSEQSTTFGPYFATSGIHNVVVQGQRGGDGGTYGGGGGGGTGGGGGRGADGLIFIQYKSTIDNTTNTIVFHYTDNHNSPWIVPSDWSQSNFVYLQGAGGCGGAGTPTQGGRGGAGGAASGGYDVTAFTPGQEVPYFVAPGCSGVPTTLGKFAAATGQDGDFKQSNFGLSNVYATTFPCQGTSGDGTVGPPRPPVSAFAFGE